MDFANMMEQAQSLLTLYAMNVVGALVILLLGVWAAKLVIKIYRRVLESRNVDQTLVNFSQNIIYAGLVAFVIIAAIGQLGVQTASFIAVLGAAGLAVGLALQGSLSNFAAGVMVLIFRPFGIGDLIEGAGVMGVVEDIHIFTTQLKTGDNRTVFIPNGKLISDNLVNFTKKGTRRMDLVIGVGYDDDLKKVKQTLTEILAKEERILKDPAPTVALLEFGDSSVNWAVRPWVTVADYWDVYFNVMEKIKLDFDGAGISIPFPQRDVHLISGQTSKEEAA